MFSLIFKILADDPFRIRYFVQSINDIFKEICEPIKIGASYLCAPNQDTLILLFLNSQSIKDINISLKIISNNAMYIVQTMQELNNRLRSQGFHITLSEASTTSM
ncbi:hypothetical protein [Saccharolobus caldissimus]|uniref:Uncharacterized protein n=1 Tax=Saccharolobus caldissimus TaxID=1702097 RepID=A0AAQ4CPP2_9CREN|nr:hypothetical protein [Saccharolobus caldissimus]BDB97773.1 hypothetical protein SACC_07900 [Saccharolobus caldissimus]